MTDRQVRAGVARIDITPPPGVELTGWGYFIQRVWKDVKDPLFATALVVDGSSDDATGLIAVVSLDLMVIDTAFTRRVRERVADSIGIRPDNILLTCSHSHNAPAAGGLLGVGECDEEYEIRAAEQTATAIEAAHGAMQPVRFRHAACPVPGLTFNRTRPNGLTDCSLTVSLLEDEHSKPLAVLINYAGHPTLGTELNPYSVSRDLPGVICDLVEQALPGVTAMYLQGACGDTNFRREFQKADRIREPADMIARTAVELLGHADVDDSPAIAACCRTIQLPTRRWTQQELDADRAEALERLAEENTEGWRESIGRVMTNRPDDMIRRHGGDETKAVMAMCRFNLEWTSLMELDVETRPEWLETEVQAVRLGRMTIVANSSEFFSPFALQIREQSGIPFLMFACYSNGRIGYLPDQHDIEARSYAGYQSPKYCNQFPFTAESGAVMISEMLAVIHDCQSTDAC